MNSETVFYTIYSKPFIKTKEELYLRYCLNKRREFNAV